MEHNYTESSIKSLDWKEHIRLRPGMYIGKLGDGSSDDDGIYILVKEVIDNCIDEFAMGFGKQIEITLTQEGSMTVRDFERHTSRKANGLRVQDQYCAKYDSEAFKKSVGLNGVGIKAVNALSTEFRIEAFREGATCRIDFARGEVLKQDRKKIKRPWKRMALALPLLQT